jgi:BirA family biotin operon repressor/biotin-[acetyl-CoA-carboxylase] ligase
MTVLWDIQVFDNIPSTQDTVKSRAADGAPEGAVVQALAQTSGRGRHGRVWEMGAGNLALSFLLRPECSAQEIGQISILIGVALAQSIGEQAVLKWPNDVMIAHKKCAGILIESDLNGADVNWLCVGVGVNTQSAPEMGAALNVPCDAFRDRFLAAVSDLYETWRHDGFESIRQAWLARTYPKGTPLNIGAFEDLDTAGNLIVRDGQNTLQRYSSGDVYLKEDHYAAGD